MASGNQTINVFPLVVQGSGNDDTLINGGSNATILGADGNDLILNTEFGNHSSLNGGNGNDTVFSSSDGATIDGGLGDDIISLNGGRAVLKYSGGNDTVIGFNDFTEIGFKYDKLEEVGGDVVLHIGENSVLLKNTSRRRLLFTKRGTDGDDFIRISSTVSYVVGADGNDTIINEAGSSTLKGDKGDDFISSYGDRAMYVSIDGGQGNDSILAGGSRSTILGGAGDDYINNTGSNNAVDGGAGNDYIVGEGNGGDGNDTIFGSGNGGAGNDYIFNDYSRAALNGDDGNDTLVNSGYYATLDGGSGNDVISLVGGSAVILHSGGNDIIFGFDDKATLGFDYDSVERAGNDVIMRLGNGSVTFKNLTDKQIDQLAPIAASDKGDTIYNEKGWTHILGGAGNDSIYHFYGSSVTINGAGGNDTIIDDDGDDASLLGGAGDDYIYSNKSATIDGGDGQDTITCTVGDSSLNGGAGNDLIIDLYKYYSPSTLNGGAGDDTLSLEGGSARIEYTSGNDVIIGYNDRTTLGFNYDSIEQSGNDVVMRVGDGSITLKDTPISIFTGRIDGKANYINDNITNRLSNKYIATYSGADTINNRGSNVIINAGDDNDSIVSAHASNVSINGGRGNDKIFVSSGINNTINGGAGNDSIRISSSSVVLQYEDGNDTVIGFDDRTTLDFNIDDLKQSGSNVIATVGNGSILFQNTTLDKVIPKVRGTDGDDAITLDGGVVRLEYGGGNDTVFGFNEKVSLGFDFDSIAQSRSDVIMTVGDGSVTFKDASLDSFITTATIDGDRAISLDGGFARVDYAGGDGTVYGYSDKTTLNFDFDSAAQVDGDVVLTVDDDAIIIKDTSIDAFKVTLTGSDADDFILNSRALTYVDGGSGNDNLINNAKDVTICGGSGDDLISLSGGNDVVSYADGDGNDTVYGFNRYAKLDAVYDSVIQSGADVIMSIGEGSITFKNIFVELFDAGNSAVRSNANDQLSSILEPAAPIVLGEPDFDVSKIILSIDKKFGSISSVSRHKNMGSVIKYESCKTQL